MSDQLRVGMLTSVGSNCGIAAYTASLIDGLSKIADVTIEPILEGQQPIEHYQQQASRLNECDVIHIQHEHSFWGGIMPRKSMFWHMRYLLKKPVVITAHTTTALRDLLKTDAEKRLPQKLVKLALLSWKSYRDGVETAPFITGRTIVHTAAARQDLINRGAKGEYIHVISAGVPRAIVSPTGGTEFRAQHSLESKSIVSLFGFIAPNKGYEIALEALEDLDDNVVLVIAGGARTSDMEPYLETLRGEIAKTRLAGRVIITRYLDDNALAEVMAASDLAITPHTYATGSYSVMVPLAYGKAIIASDMDCFVEIAEDGGALKIVNAGSSAELTDAINALLSDDVSRHKLESAATEYSNRRSWDAVALQTLQVYKEAILDETRLAHHGHH
ncbi:MAG: glycosyltransferase [Chthonomonadales bacterium]